MRECEDFYGICLTFSDVCELRRMLEPLAQLAGCQQIFDIAIAAYQNALYKHHGEGGPASPQFEGVAFAPVAEITAVFQIMMLDIGI